MPSNVSSLTIPRQRRISSNPYLGNEYFGVDVNIIAGFLIEGPKKSFVLYHLFHIILILMMHLRKLRGKNKEYLEANSIKKNNNHGYGTDSTSN